MKIVPPNLVDRQPDCPWDCMGHFIPCIRLERQRLIEKCVRTVIDKHPANRMDAEHIAMAPDENLVMLQRMEDHHLLMPVFIVAIRAEWRMMMLSGTTPNAALLESIRRVPRPRRR